MIDFREQYYSARTQMEAKLRAENPNLKDVVYAEQAYTPIPMSWRIGEINLPSAFGVVIDDIGWIASARSRSEAESIITNARQVYHNEGMTGSASLVEINRPIGEDQWL